SRRRHTRFSRDWSSDVCSSDLGRIIEPAEANEVLNAVLDAGINFIDTSPDYGPSEEMIGQSIANRRDEYFLATKCGCPVTVEQRSEERRVGKACRSGGAACQET